MVPEYEQVAESRDRIGPDLRNRIFIDEGGRGIPRFEQPLEFHVEADQVEIVILLVKNRESRCEAFPHPTLRRQ